MKNALLVLVFGMLSLHLVHAGDFGDNAFFRALTGTWKGEGKITFSDGKSRPLGNRIVAAFDPASAVFTIQGALVLGEENGDLTAKPTSYRWEIRPSQKTAGAFEGRMVNLDDGGDTTLYEIAVDPAALTARFVQVPAAGQDRLEMTKQVKGGEYLSRFTFFNPSGEQTASGQVKFAREP